MPTNKNFGLTFSAIFMIVVFYCIYFDYKFLIFLFLSFAFLLLGLINSKILFPFNWLWHKFGLLLSRLLSPLILTLFFYIIVTPYGYLARIFSQDIKNIKKNKKNLINKSFWINCNESCDFNKQF